MSDPFVAEVRIFAGNFAPRGWAFCNGQILPIAQNTALFSLVGTTFGGDGETSFGLPDLQDRIPMHPGNGPGLTQRRLGEKGGVDNVTLSSAQMPNHTHTLRSFSGADQAQPSAAAGMGTAEVYAAPGAVVPMDSGAVGATGGGQSHDNEQPLLSLNFIIALQGIFPPRN